MTTLACYRALVPLTLLVLFGMHQVYAAELLVEVQDSKGAKLKDAVVFVENTKTAGIAPTAGYELEQKSKQFNPQVSVVQVGTSINFPNRDKVRHHVYSFSPAKKFELKLYSGVPANPVLFDKAGTVVLGCNIHDTMLAYVYIVDTPYFAKTDSNGVAKLANVPEENYILKVWHYALQQENKVVEQSISVKSSNKAIPVKLEINHANLIQGE
ncbi:hypothetical protein Meth11DRAFT_0035 [Methylophilaceae bacterium 11]|nr:hypothetical protein Meth11DRAFT_0035 [Methylophilaceae bacterium 11]